MISGEQFVTVQEAAAELGIHEATVRQALYDGRLPYVEMYGRKLIARADMDAYKARTQPHGEKRVGRPKSVLTESGQHSKIDAA